MADRWPLVGREEELALIGRGFSAPGARSSVIAGVEGVGKTRLALEALALAEAAGFSTFRVHASRAASSIPLGAFAPLLPDPEPAPAARRRFVRRAASDIAALGAGRVVIVVDDAHLLDESSSALVRQLVLTAGVIVLATLRTGEPVLDELATIWTEGLADRIEIQPLARQEVEELTHSALGGSLDGALVERLWTWSRGNPLYLREVLRGATESNDVVLDGSVWRLAKTFTATPRLVELVEARLNAVSSEEAPILELLAFDEHLSSAVVEAQFGGESLTRLERSGLIGDRSEDPSGTVRFAHPLYAEVMRARMPATRRKSVQRVLADLIERSSVRRHGDAMRLALLRLEADGTASAETLSDAAQEAHFAADYPLAERFARAALDAGATWHTRRLLAEVLRWEGRFEQAEEELRDIDPTLAKDDSERALLAMTRADNLFRGLNRREDAERILALAKESLVDAGWRMEIDARRAFFDILSGDVRTGLEPSLAVAAGKSSRAAVTASLAGTFGLAATGRCDEAVALAERGFAHASSLGAEFMVLPREAQRFASCLALIEAGHLSEAERTGRETYEHVVSEGIFEGQASLASMLGRALVLRGRLQQAARFYREAALIWRDILGPLQRWCWSGAACASAAAGDVDAAERVLGELNAVPASAFQLFEVDIERARAWVSAARGELSLARTSSIEAAHVACERGLFAFEADLLHDVVRFGGARDVHERLAELATLVEGPMSSIRADHAAGVAAGDGRVLDEVAASFERIGADLLAAEAAGHAALAWQDAGHRRAAAASATRGRELLAGCENARTPALLALDVSAHLTPREGEIARLASFGRSSREIADVLSLSVRTVENHLQRIYEKLGVRSRAELRERLS